MSRMRPFGGLRGFRNPFGQQSSQRNQQFPPLEKEEEDDLIDSILSKSMGALQWVGETLDKPGRAVRGLLGGKPEELLNLVPLSDSFGLTDPKDSVSGRDLLEQSGVLGYNEEGFDFGDVAGFAADVALDPLTYVGLGGLTQAGKAATKSGKFANAALKSTDDIADAAVAAGKLAPSLRSGIKAGQRSSFSVGLPFTEGVHFGVGDTAIRNIGLARKYTGIDALGQSSFGRGAKRLFDSSVGNMKTAAGQAFSKAMNMTKSGDELQRVGAAHALGQEAHALGLLENQGTKDLIRDFVEAIPEKNVLDEGGEGMRDNYLKEITRDKVLRDSNDKISKDAGGNPQYVLDADGEVAQESFHTQKQYRTDAEVMAQSDDPLKQEAFDHAQKIKAELKKWQDTLEADGLAANQLRDMAIEYSPRYAYQFPTAKGFFSRISDTFKRKSDEAFKGRRDLFKNIPHGTSAVNDVAEKLSGWKTTAEEAHRKTGKVLSKRGERDLKFGTGQGGLLDKTAQDLFFTDPSIPFKHLPKSIKNQTNKIVDYFASHTGRYNETARFFNADIFVDMMTKSRRVSKVHSSAAMLRGMATDVAADFGRPITKNDLHKGFVEIEGKKFVPFTEVMEEAGFANFQDNMTGKLKDVVEPTVGSFQGGAITKDTLGDLIQSGPNKKVGEHMGRWMVPAEEAQEVMQYMASWRNPPEVKGILKGLDIAQNIFKGSVTQPWLAFHARNGFGGSYYNIVSGAVPAKDFIKSSGETASFLRGGPIPELTNPSTGVKLTREEAFAQIDSAGFTRTNQTVEGHTADVVSGAMNDNTSGLINYDAPGRGVVEATLLRGRKRKYGLKGKRQRYSPEIDNPNDLGAGVNDTHFDIIDLETGNTVSDIRIIKEDDGFAYVDTLGDWRHLDDEGLNAGSNKLGPAAIKDVLSDYVEMFPDVKEIGGSRIGGAAGRKLDSGILETSYTGYPVEKLLRGSKKKRSEKFSAGTPSRPETTALESGVNWLKGFGSKGSLKRAGEHVASKKGKASKALASTEVLAGAGSHLLGKGRELGNATEEFLRVQHWLGRIKQGYSFEAAAESVYKWHFDYASGASTQFEKNVMKRIFPFYRFARANMPLVFKELVKNPGGGLAQTVRFANSARAKGQYIPEYLGEGAAIPSPFGGKDSFITGLGLPVEEPFERFRVNLSDPRKMARRNAEKLIANMRPEIGLGYTAASGRDAFFGRDINEGFQYPTPSPGVNAVLSKSPLGRGIGSFRKATDERKSLVDRGLNLFTGVKQTNVSGGLERQRMFETKRTLQEIMRTEPKIKQFQTPYVLKDDADSLGKKQTDYMRLSRSLTKRGREEAKQRRILNGGR